MLALVYAFCVSRYRHQLDSFIDKLRGREPEHWIDAQDSIANMEWIEAIYKEVCRVITSLVPIGFPSVSTSDWRP
jgi:hypothetical protein